MSDSQTFNGADGRSVVAADTADNIGEVKGFVIDRTATRIDAIHVAGRGRKAGIIPWSAIRSFGDDAVVAVSAEATEQVDSDHDTQAVKGKINLRGARVLTTSGFEAGTVDDVTFDATTGQLTGAVIGNGRIDASRFRSLGSYALVVDPEG